MIDWKKVARERGRRVKELEQWQQARRCQIYNELRRELGTQLHARCIANSEPLSVEIARVVSERITDL